MDGTSGGAPIVREDILALKFPTKLWLLVNTPNNVVRWCSEGASFTIDFLALDGYLCSPSSVFRIKTKSVFVSYLTAYGFEDMKTDNCKSTEEGFIWEFKHEYFLRGRSDLVEKIVKQPGAIVGRCHDLGLAIGVQQQGFRPLNQQYDPCHGLIKNLSQVEKARLNLRIILQVQAESYILQKKLSESSENTPSSAMSVIEVPAEAFENPLESISRFKENPEIAGFYGHASTDLVKHFFDAYLPLYAASNADANAKPAGDSTTSQTEGPIETANPTQSMAYMEPDPRNNVPQYQSPYPSNVQLKYSVSLEPNESREYTFELLDETSGELTTAHQYGAKICAENEPYYGQSNASALEPIYRNCDEDAEANNKEDDISMDQYLKFKSSTQKNDGAVENASEDVQMEEDKTENGPPNTEESNEDNENFRNFFNHYRESINLLYE